MTKVPASLLRTLERLALSRKRGGKRRGGRARRRTTTRKPKMAVLSDTQAQHAQLMQRPFVCNLPSSPCIYEGEQGTINRFTVDGSITLGATNTAAIYIFHPNTGGVYSLAVNAPSDALGAIGLQTNVTFTPGFNTLNSVANKLRSVAAATRMTIPSLSLTTIVGEFAFGIASLDTVLNFTNVNSAFQYSQARHNVTRDLHELRWYPGSFDSKYATMIAGAAVVAASGTDVNDTNALFFAVRGLPAATTIGVTTTNIVEWTPRPQSGLSVSGASSAGSNHQHTVDVLHKHSPGWHHTAKQTAERLLEDTVRDIGERAGPKLRLAAGKIFEGGLAAFGL